MYFMKLFELIDILWKYGIFYSYIDNVSYNNINEGEKISNNTKEMKSHD